MKKKTCKPYSAEEISLLKLLCTAQPALTWREIITHFPDRTEAGLKDRWAHIQPKDDARRRRRPIHAVPKPPAPASFIRDNDETKRIREASQRLGAAIDAMLQRQAQRMAA